MEKECYRNKNIDDYGGRDARPPSGIPDDVSDIPSGNPYYDKDEEMFVTIGHLPHVSERRKLYATTFRLYDSLPHDVVKMYMQDCERAFGDDVPSFQTKREAMLHKKMMALMDAGYGECLLKDNAVRRIVEEAFEFVGNKMAMVHAFVIMPNHVHAVLETQGSATIQQVMHSLKSYTSHGINRLLQRNGYVWQREYYDRIIRNETHYANAIDYIRNNPRHCNEGEYTLKITKEATQTNA